MLHPHEQRFNLPQSDITSGNNSEADIYIVASDPISPPMVNWVKITVEVKTFVNPRETFRYVNDGVRQLGSSLRKAEIGLLAIPRESWQSVPDRLGRVRNRLEDLLARRFTLFGVGTQRAGYFRLYDKLRSNARIAYRGIEAELAKETCSCD